MKKTFPILAALALALATSPAQEPTPTPEANAGRAVWRAILPGGTYIVNLSAISSVSIHEYLVDGAARVTEVNISSIGTEAVRFYYIEPNTPQMPGGVGQSGIELLKEKVQEGVSRAGADDVWQKVVKNYPTTTHARTVEYRLTSKESLTKLFKHVEDAWINRKPATFKP